MNNLEAAELVALYRDIASIEGFTPWGRAAHRRAEELERAGAG